MKTKRNKLIGALAFVLVFVAGYALGLLLDLPNIESGQASGTIGRVNNYRNSKATEGDIALKEDLLKDEKQQTAMVKYLNYNYAKSLAYTLTTTYVLEQAAAVPAFAAQCDKLDAMKDYAKFLENSRKMLLLASIFCQDVDSAEPSALRNSLNQASNVIARMTQYQSTVLAFMDQLEGFLSKNGSKTYMGLSKAYDQLLSDQLGSVMVSQDKVLASYLSKKHLQTAVQSDQQPDVKAALQVDLKTLDASFPRDMEKLGMMDKEKLGSMMNDVEQLGIIYDSEKLGLVFDAEKLGTSFTDAEKLGACFTDSEKLGSFINCVNCVNDAERVGSQFALGMVSVE